MIGAWWVWALAALGLGILEMLAPGFIFLGFALGAGAVALLLAVGGPLAGWLAASAPLLLLAFALLSLAAWFALRALFGRPGQRPRTFDHDIND